MTEVFPDADLAACAKREVAQRRRVYARLVVTGRMEQAKADKEIALMQAIADHFQKRADDEAAKGRLL